MLSKHNQAFLHIYPKTQLHFPFDIFLVTVSLNVVKMASLDFIWLEGGLPWVQFKPFPEVYSLSYLPNSDTYQFLCSGFCSTWPWAVPCLREDTAEPWPALLAPHCCLPHAWMMRKRGWLGWWCVTPRCCPGRPAAAAVSAKPTPASGAHPTHPRAPHLINKPPKQTTMSIFTHSKLMRERRVALEIGSRRKCSHCGYRYVQHINVRFQCILIHPYNIMYFFLFISAL